MPGRGSPLRVPTLNRARTLHEDGLPMAISVSPTPPTLPSGHTPSPEPSPEIRRPQVTLKTVFLVCFGVLAVAGLVFALSRALIAITLSVVALLMAIAVDHAVALLTRRGLH